MKQQIPIEEAIRLWSNGWCWEALGKKYGFYKDTVKKRTAEFIGEAAREARYVEKKHRRCPFHYADQLLLFEVPGRV